MPKPKVKVPVKYKAFREYIKTASGELQKLFYVTDWDITLDFQEEVETSEHGGAKGTACAEIMIDDTYHNCRIYAYKGLYDLFVEGDLEGVEKYLIHEFAHILTEPLSNIIEMYAPIQLKEHNLAIVERQTERIKNIICHVKSSVLNNKKKTQ